jgi:hypothetical protein
MHLGTVLRRAYLFVLGWIPLDASLANIYSEEIELTDKYKRLVELTTATGYHRAEFGKVENKTLLRFRCMEFTLPWHE